MRLLFLFLSVCFYSMCYSQCTDSSTYVSYKQSYIDDKLYMAGRGRQWSFTKCFVTVNMNLRMMSVRLPSDKFASKVYFFSECQDGLGQSNCYCVIDEEISTSKITFGSIMIQVSIPEKYVVDYYLNPR